MSGQIRDIKDPPAVVAGAASGTLTLDSATGLDLVAVRIIRLLFLMPGELLHRPLLGGGLEAYRGKVPTPETLRRLNLSIRALLDTLPYIQRYEVKLARVDGSQTSIDITADVDGQRLTIPTITI